MNEKWRTKYWGKYLGVVRDYYDPENLGRLRIEIPEIYGVGEERWSPWALPCLPPGRYDVPLEGEAVWVEFRDGDPSKPIWVGWLPRGTGESSTLPEDTKELCVEPPDEPQIVGPDAPDAPAPSSIPDPCEGCRERIGEKHETNDEIYYDHLPFHDHREEFYHCPRRGRYLLTPTESGHRIFYCDKEGEQRIEIEDCDGNIITLWHDFWGGIWLKDKNGNKINMSYNTGIQISTANGNLVEVKNWSDACFEEVPGQPPPSDPLTTIRSSITLKEASGTQVDLIQKDMAEVTPGGLATVVLSPGEGAAVVIKGNLVVEGDAFAPKPFFTPL